MDLFRSHLVHLIVAATLLGVRASAQEPPRDEEVKLPTVARLVADLDSDSYRVREAARRALLERGTESLGLLVEAANGDSLEVSVRALRIIEVMLERAEGDDEIELTEDALDRLVASPKPGTAERAAELAEGMGPIRERRALARLERLGATIEVSTDSVVGIAGRTVVQPITVYLDPADWKGGDDGLKYIRRVSRITRLYIVKKAISKEAEEAIIADIPGLDVQHRGGAYLGIGGSQLAGVEGCFVQTVKAGTAASAGGIEAGDIIHHFGGKKVAGFQELIELIGEHAPGDKVVAKVTRNGTDEVELEITLGQWADNAANLRPRPVTPPDEPPAIPQPLPDLPPNRPPR